MYVHKTKTLYFPLPVKLKPRTYTKVGTGKIRKL